MRGPPLLAVLELERRGHVVAGEALRALVRQVGAAGIGDPDLGGPAMRAQPGQDVAASSAPRSRHRRTGSRSQRQSAPTTSPARAATATPLSAAFSGDGGQAIGSISAASSARAGAGRRRSRRARRRRRNRARGLPRDQRRVVEHMSGEGLAAGPGEGPERGRRCRLGQPGLGRLPDRRDLASRDGADLGHERGGGR